MRESTYPLFRKGCVAAFILWAISIVFWQSSVLSFALGALPIIVTIAWRNKEFPAFPFAFSFQWLQVSLGIIWRDVFGTSLSAVDHPQIDLACYLGIIGLLVLGIGVRFGFFLAEKMFTVQPLEEPEEVNYSVKKIFAIYLILLFVTPFVAIVSWKFLPLRSIMVTIFVLQHFIVFLLFYLAICYNRAFYIVGTLLLEIVQGMVGYFSGYKTSLLIFAIVAFANLKRLTLRMRYVLVLVLFLLMILSVVWQAVKPELRRAFADRTLSLTSPIEKKIKFVYRLAETIFRGNEYPYQTQSQPSKVYDLVNRISNIYYFACTLGRIPSEVPHEEGTLLRGSLMHIFTPRLFFPEKPGLPSDSWMVRTYAGINVAGGEGNLTNIALGYLVENYIDFGIPYMFLPVFILGAIAAIMYRFIFKIAVNYIMANVLSASIFFFNFYLFEKANIKIFGNLLADYIVSVAALMLFQKSFLKFITNKDYGQNEFKAG